MNTFFAVVAHELYVNQDWRDESSYPFVYPSIFADMSYFDMEKWKNGSLKADVQIDEQLLTAGCEGRHCDMMFILSTGNRRYGHFSLIRVMRSNRRIEVYDPYNGADSCWLMSCCASFVGKAYEELTPTIIAKDLHSKKAGDWMKRRIHSVDPVDKCACGPLCLEQLVKLVVVNSETFG